MLRSTGLVLALVLTACVATSSNVAAQAALLQRVTPILVVDEIEPVIGFWTSLGFQPNNPAEENGDLVFLAFNKDGLAIHYHTMARVERDMGDQAGTLRGSTSLVYLTVSNVQAIIDALPPGTEIVIPRRSTPWGADEIYVREPGGHLIAFAEFGD